MITLWASIATIINTAISPVNIKPQPVYAPISLQNKQYSEDPLLKPTEKNSSSIDDLFDAAKEAKSSLGADCKVGSAKQGCPLSSVPEIDKINSADLNSYITFLKNQENSTKDGFRDGKFYPISAPEKNGGLDIAYGHKLSGEKNLLNGIDEKQAEELLKQDVAKKLDSTKKSVNKLYPGKWDKLDSKTKLFLTDYQFNTTKGIKGFPKLLDSTVNGNWTQVNQDYKRHWTDKDGNKKELKNRNDGVYNFFIKDNL